MLKQKAMGRVGGFWIIAGVDNVSTVPCTLLTLTFR